MRAFGKALSVLSALCAAGLLVPVLFVGNSGISVVYGLGFAWLARRLWREPMLFATWRPKPFGSTGQSVAARRGEA